MWVWSISTLIAMATMKRTRDISVKPRKISNGYNVRFTKRKRGHLAGIKLVAFMPVSI
jgi:hypothetical protein